MAKLTLNNISAGFQSNTAANTNNDLIEAAIENTLSRDGTAPNTMGADLDMNNNALLNVASLNGLDGTLIGDIAAQEAAALAAQVAAEAAQAAAEAAQVATAADVVLTHADVVLTNADVVSTNADVLLTAADVITTGLDVTATNADVVSTGLNKTAAEAAQAAAEVAQTGAETAQGLAETARDAAQAIVLGDVIHTATSKSPPVGNDELGIWDSVSTGVRKLTFTNLASYLSGLCSAGWNAFTATTANRVDSSFITVASHATTADIFGAAGNSIYWTGTATTTAFAAASKAGITRKLFCSDACSFTASGTFEIQGVPSGNTITLGAGAIVEVMSLDAAGYSKITNYSYSGSFTITGTGFAVDPTGTAYFRHENGIIDLFIPALTGTSNLTTFGLTGFPTSIIPASDKQLSFISAIDNSAYVIAVIFFSSGSVGLSNGVWGGAWTAAGTKTLLATDITYSMY